MLPEEKIRVGLLLGSVLLVYGAAAAFLVRAVWTRGTRRRPPQGHGRLRPALRRVRAAVLALAALGVACGLYARLIEPTWLEVKHVEVASGHLSTGARVRIVHITDVHSDPEARLEPRLPERIAAERPDLIVFTGDSLNAIEGLPHFRALMTSLAAIAPTYAVRGNWDTRLWRDVNLFGGTGVVELDDRAVRAPLAGVELWIAGVAADGADRLEEAVAGVPRGAASVVLHHYPDEIDRAAALGVNLYLAGHTHGGQVALPLYGALVTLSRFGKRLEAGLYRVKRTSLYVGRGIGMEGGGAPRVRFFARPEVAVIDLVGMRP